jgi:hypothetical protein
VPPPKHEEPTNRDELFAAIKAAGGSCKGLGRASDAKLKEKLAALKGTTNVEAKAAPVETPKATTTTEAKPAKKGGFKKAMDAVIVPMPKPATWLKYRTKKGKDMDVLLLEHNSKGYKVMNPEKDQTGVAAGFIKGCVWMAQLATNANGII